MHQETQLAPGAPGTAFRQKSIAVSLVVIGATAIHYFLRALELGQSSAALPGAAVPLVIGTVVLIIMVEAVLQAVLAIGAGRVPAPTARDPLVSALAARNAYFVLVAGTLAAFAGFLLGQAPFLVGNVLLLGFILAEMTRLASQLVLYRPRA